MLNFQKINLESTIELKKYLYQSEKIGSDYSLEVIYSWSKELDTQVAFYNDDAFIKSYYAIDNYCYYLPLVKKFDHLNYLFDDFIYNSNDKAFELCNLTLEEAESIKKLLPHSNYFFDRKWSDYIYLVEDLAYFKGNKYASKRHHVAHFIKTYPNVVLKEATELDKDAIKDFILNFGKEKTLNSREGKFEFNSSLHLVDVYDKLGFRCFLLLDDNKIIGINILEFKNDVIYNHIEKCYREYEGIYPYLVSTICKMFVGKYKYINREDDSGDLGLRYSKEEYHPIFMYDKYLLLVKNNLDLLTSIPTLVVNEDITIKELDEKDKDLYATLNLDDERNKYWGYDYRKDLKEGDVPNGDYFYNVVKEDFKNKECFVFAIYYKNQFAGEVVAYSPLDDNSCEIGYRIFKKYEGNNIGYLATQKVINFLKKHVKIKYFSIKSYKVNKKSLSIIERLDGKFDFEDETFKYYKIY